MSYPPAASHVGLASHQQKGKLYTATELAEMVKKMHKEAKLMKQMIQEKDDELTAIKVRVF